jgi:predicted nucleotidyltransferase
MNEANYILDLTGSFPCIREIWLFGSRANGTAQPNSDWDLLVFTDNDGLLGLLEQDRKFEMPGIDLFIVGADGHTFKQPWPRGDGSRSSGSLDHSYLGWKRRKLSATEARYEARKEPNPHLPQELRAVRRFPAAGDGS